MRKQRWSNREIARQCGVTHTFVAKLRRELLGESPSAMPAGDSAAVRTEPMGVAEPQRPAAAALPDVPFTGTGDEIFEAPAARSRDDLFDQLSPTEPASTMERLAYEHREPVAEPTPMAAPAVVEPNHQPVTQAAMPRATSPISPGVAPASEAKLTIEAMAATSQQAPAEWVAEMMVYWLLDLGTQYEGMTPELVRQAADKLGQQCASVPGHRTVILTSGDDEGHFVDVKQARLIRRGQHVQAT